MPIPHSAVAGAMLLRRLRRRCPQCGAEFHVPLDRQADVVVCDHCGRDVPPKQST